MLRSPETFDRNFLQSLRIASGDKPRLVVARGRTIEVEHDDPRLRGASPVIPASGPDGTP